jgi:hypothetical protein
MRTKIISRIIVAGLLVLGASPATATQTIVGPFRVTDQSMTAGSFDITPPTSNSPGKWTFVADNPLVATIVGTKVTLLSSGFTRITATQAASGAYNSVTRVTQLLVTKGNPTVETWAPMTVPYSAGKFTITPPKSNSDGAWSYTINGPGIVTQSGNVLTLLDGGLVSINARQASTAGWNAVTAYTTLNVSLVAPTLGTFGDVTFNRSSISNLTLVPPTSNSSGPWSFSSSDPSVATISGTLLTPVSIGKTTITASQAKSKPFGAATATMVLTVVGTAPTAGAFNDITSTFATGKYTLTAPTSSSPGPWTYSSSDNSVATVSGAVVTFVKPGIVTLTANQAATGTYNAVGPLNAKLTITQAPTIGVVQTITKVIGDPDFVLPLPSTNSSSAFVFTSSDANVISVTGGSAKIVGAGSATITANLPAKDYWLSGSTSFAVQVLGTLPTLGAFNAFTISTADKNVPIVAPASTSKGVWVFTSSNPAVALVTGGSITGVAVGTATITAVQNPSGVFGQSNTLQTTVIVTVPVVKPTPSIAPTPIVTSTPSVQPSVTVVLGTKLITVSSSSQTIKVFIDGRAGIVGKNVVKAGKHVVQIQNGSTLLYSKLVTVK